MRPAPMILILCTLCMVGCGHHEEPDAGGHAHVHKAPHGGHLVEVGEHEANLEFLWDAETSTLTVWVLGPHAVQPMVPAQDRIRLEMFHPARGGTIQVELQQDPVDRHVFRTTEPTLAELERIEGVILQLDVAGKQRMRLPFVLD